VFWSAFFVSKTKDTGASGDAGGNGVNPFEDIRSQVPANVKIIAVTKGHDHSAIESAVQNGFTDIGENYAQEAVHKQALASPDSLITWHFIGQLQRNKVRLLAPFVHVWHTVDNIALIKEVAKRAAAAQILLQVNLTDDANRGGCQWHQLEELVSAARAGDLNLIGLMGVAPQGDDVTVRASFRRLADSAAHFDLPELSMGMSADWPIAVEEGATMIRLGSTLFGPRKPRVEG
jgi:PLP dependent protein